MKKRSSFFLNMCGSSCFTSVSVVALNVMLQGLLGRFLLQVLFPFSVVKHPEDADK